METETKVAAEPTDEELQKKLEDARALAGVTPAAKPTGTRSSSASAAPQAESEPQTRTKTCPCGREFLQTFASTIWLPTRCPDCIERAERESREWEESRRKDELRARLTATGVPRLYRERTATLDTFRAETAADRRALEACRSMLEEPHGKAMLLTGGVGTGKTHLAASTVAEWITRGRLGARFTTHQDLLLRVRATFRDGATESDLDVIHGYRTAHLLAIDDLGAEKASQHSVSTLYAIVNYRYGECLPTILTSNFNPQRLAAHLSFDNADMLQAERILDRIVGAGEWIELDGPSHRRQ